MTAEGHQPVRLPVGRIVLTTQPFRPLLHHDPAGRKERDQVRRRHQAVERVGELPDFLQSADRANRYDQEEDDPVGQDRPSAGRDALNIGISC